MSRYEIAKRRFLCSCMAAWLMINMIFTGPLQLTVHAAAAAPALPAVSPEASVEMMEILYTLLVNGMIASGAAEADYSDIDSGTDLFASFMDYLSVSMGSPAHGGPAWAKDTTFTLSDGTVVTYEQLLAYSDAVLSGTIVLDPPTDTGEELAPGLWGELGMTRSQWQQKIADPLLDFNASGGGSGDGSNDDDGNKKPEFSHVKAVTIAAGFLGTMGAFIADLWDGKVEGQDPDTYFFPDVAYDDTVSLHPYAFSGTLDQDETGMYIVRGNAARSGSCAMLYPDGHKDVWGHFVHRYDISFTYPTPVVAVYEPISDWSSYVLNFYSVSATNPDQMIASVYKKWDVSCSYTPIDADAHPVCGATDHGTTVSISVSGVDDLTYYVNVPVFTSLYAARAFLLQSKNSGYINSQLYDHSSLAHSVPSTLGSLAGKQLKPDAMLSVYQDTAAVYDTVISPAVSPYEDKETQTQTYQQTIQDTITDTSTQVEADPSDIPAPKPGTDTEPDTGTETNTEIDDYKTDLRMVFPFCLPFDFIHLLNVLDADPVAPCFDFPFVVPALGIDMTFQIDLSFLETAMAVFRVGETVCFILLLISATSKLIRW